MAGVAVSRRPKKDLERPPNGLERGEPPGSDSYGAAGAIAQTQQAISRAVAQFATHGLLPAWDMASRLSCRRRLHFAACLDAAGATPWPGLGFLGCLVDIGTCQDVNANLRFTV